MAAVTICSDFGPKKIKFVTISIFPTYNAKICSNYFTIALISHAGKAMVKILQARLQQYVTVNFQMFKLDLENAEEPNIKVPTSAGSSEKRIPERHLFLLLLTMPNPSTVWITTNYEKFLKRWE